MSVLQDVRYGARMLASRPGVTAAAVLSLALGVGANSAVFSLLDAVILRPLPVDSPQELVILGPARSRGMSISDEPVVDLFSYPRYLRLKNGAKSLETVAAIASTDAGAYMRQADNPALTRASARMVSGEYFSLFGVRPAAGRLFGTTDDQTPGAHPVVVLDHRFWQEQFGGDPAVVGSAVTLGDHAFSIVGVAEPSFAGEQLGDRPDLYAPLAMQAEIRRDRLYLQRPEVSFLLAMGRLKQGVSREAAETELASLWRSILMDEAGGDPTKAWLRGIEREKMILQPGARGFNNADELENPLWLLFGVTLLVLLIACANVANLLLARSAGRGREMGVRVALGAARGRLYRQLLVESLLLAAVAGAAALLVSVWSRDVLIAMAGADAADLRIGDGLDWRVLSYTAVAALATGLLFGTAPAWRAGLVDVRSQLAGGRGTVGGSSRLRTALVVGQGALSLILLFGAGLFVESLGKLARAETGLAAESLLSVSLDPRGAGFTEEEQPQLARRILPAVEAVPGVRSAAMSLMPLLVPGRRTDTVGIPGYEPAPGEDMDARMMIVTPGFFETVGTEILSGRSLQPQDREGAALTAVVDRNFADRFFGGADPVGRAVELSGAEARIVGLARTAKLNGVREPGLPTVYVSVFRSPDMMRGLSVRAVGEPSALADAVRQAVASAEPRLPVLSVETAESRLVQQSTPDRMLLRLISGFGLLALLLSAVGLYGVLSCRVAGRTGEIGLRMAVGADRRDILRLVLREGLGLAAAGVTIGLIAAPFAGRAVALLLYQTEPWSLTPLAVSAAVLMASAAAAALAPSLRAARLNPVAALREE